MKELKSLCVKATKAYHNGTPIMSDAKFDQLEDKIRATDPTWKELTKTGAAVPNKKTEVALAHPMPSLNKAYPEAIGKWLLANEAEHYIVMDKLDGSSLQVTYQGGKPVKVVTRGNGDLGGDISFLIPHLNLPPNRSKGTVVYRCEAVMKRATFGRKWATEFDNPRNMVNGILNRKTPHPALADTDIVVLGVFGEPLYTSLQWNSVAITKLVAARVDGTSMSRMLELRKQRSLYDIDGLVIAPESFVMDYKNSDKPKGIVAFKVNSDADAVNAVVEKIIWQVSGRGRIIPKICIKPTRIGDVTVTHAAAHNAVWMIDRKIGPGALVKLVRSGGVIPKIEAVVKPGKLQLPKIPYTMSGVHFIVTQTDAATEDHIDVQNIVKFMKTMGVELLAGKTVASMLNHFHNPMTYLLAWNNGKLAKELNDNGVGPKMAVKIEAEFDRVFSGRVSLRKLMVATQLFGVGVGDRKLQMIEDDGISMHRLERGLVTYDRLVLVPGFSHKSASLLMEGLPSVQAFVSRVSGFLNLSAELPTKKVALKNGKLTGQRVSFTSYRDKTHEAAIIAAGGEVVPFGSKTTVLLFKEGGKSSTKQDAAAAKGIKVCVFEGLGL